MNTAVALQPAPLRIHAGAEPLEEAQVTGVLKNGKSIRGRLVSLAPGSTVDIRTSDNADCTRIPLQDIRVLKFAATASLPMHPDVMATRGDAITRPPESQHFTVTYNDGEVMSGEVRNLFVDEVGIHLFHVDRNGDYQRVLIPAQAIKSHRIGVPIGEALVSHNRITRESLDTALARQDSLRNKRVGDYIRSHVVLTSADLESALSEQTRHPYEYLGSVLQRQGLINGRQLELALEEQKLDRSKKIGQILVDMGAVTAEELHLTLADNLGIPYVKLHDFDFDAGALELVSVEIARKHSLIPLALHNKRLIIAMEDPFDVEAIQLLRFTTGYSVEITISSEEDIFWAIDKHYGAVANSEVLYDLGLVADETATKSASVEDIERLGNEKPIVRLVNNIILEAINRRASDIHIRAAEGQVDLYYRIDGNLIKVRTHDKRFLPAIISRIKILGRMDIAERRLPQDGRTRVSHRGVVVDLRVSVIPTVEGETAVIRILDTRAGLKSLNEVGLSRHDQGIFTDLLNRSHGMLLVTGPTGSGKSTTLYAALNEVKRRNINVVTVEDPVEYHIDGIEQIQAYTAPNYTFARALKHILRHDPDVIMIGEIRDDETAAIAIKSAMTGHLVLSTLHTNDAASAVTRLMEMGVQPYMLGTTLIGVLAQRLVRRNCRHCLEPEDTDAKLRALLGVGADEVFYHGKGCEYCNNTGVSERVATYELMPITPGLHGLIAPDVSSAVLHSEAVKEGMVPLTQHALSLARQGAISLREVYRVRLE